MNTLLWTAALVSIVLALGVEIERRRKTAVRNEVANPAPEPA